MVATKLRDSCDTLYRDGNITQTQYDTCVAAMDEGSDIVEQQLLTETNIFGSPRAEKEAKYNEFLTNIKTVMDETLKKWKEAKEAGTAAEADKESYEKILDQLEILIENVIDWIQNLSVERHQNTEDLHYKQLVQYYNKIDNNRKELDKISKQFNTLEQKSTHQDITKNNKSDSYMAQRNIMISLIIFLIICFVIIFLLYFI
jgi:CHASE3 domain sensor protein